MDVQIAGIQIGILPPATISSETNATSIGAAVLCTARRRYEMSPLDVAFMAAVVFAVYKIVDFWIAWEWGDDGIE